MKIRNTATAGACIDQAEAALDAAGLCYGHGTDNAGAEAQWLVCAVLAQDGENRITRDTPVSPEQQARIQTLLSSRITGRRPLAYLLNEAWFAGYCFYVDERVLVPRSPMAELMENSLQPLLRGEPATILDLCCGSGCLGIACALEFPDSRVILADLSRDALVVADINIRRFGLKDRVATRHSDLYAGIPEQFDLILCNPPYVPEDEYQELPPEYRQEPAMGLVSGHDGLDMPLRILAHSGARLNEHGLLLLETGHNWRALDAALPAMPFLWLDFEHGGEGVCALTREQLLANLP